jgi:hypothetical protein
MEMQEWEGRNDQPPFADTAGTPSRQRPQTWRSLFFAPWTSQNAHDETVLVPCAQVKGSLAIPLMMRGKRNARSMTPLVGRTHAGNPPGRPLPRSSL